MGQQPVTRTTAYTDRDKGDPLYPPLVLFKDYHIPLIREHEKTVTRRVWKDEYNRPVEGSVHQAASASMVPEDAEIDSPMLLSNEECTCFVRIGEVYPEPLGDMTDEDAQKEGDYETVEEFRESWIEINGSWDPELVVDVVPIQYVGTGPWWTRVSGKGSISTYHGDDDCPRLRHCNLRERESNEIDPSWNPCPYCILPGKPENAGDYDFSYQESLLAAAKQNAEQSG